MAVLRGLDVGRFLGARKHSHPLRKSGGSPARINTSHTHLFPYTVWGSSSLEQGPQNDQLCVCFVTVYDCASPSLSDINSYLNPSSPTRAPQVKKHIPLFSSIKVSLKPFSPQLSPAKYVKP